MRFNEFSHMRRNAFTKIYNFRGAITSHNHFRHTDSPLNSRAITIFIVYGALLSHERLLFSLLWEIE